jgi:hypothetical protein
MNTIICQIGMVNYGSKDDVVLSLNDLENISAEYVSLGFGKGEIHIQVPDDFSVNDVLSLGQYIGGIQSMHLMS